MNEEVEVKVPDERQVWPPVDPANVSPIPSQHISMPTTPQGAPINPNTEYELPFELVQQGWKKFWSKRENRPYFWNKLTGESLWEMPMIKPAFDPITDPLGECHYCCLFMLFWLVGTPISRASVIYVYYFNLFKFFGWLAQLSIVWWLYSPYNVV